MPRQILGRLHILRVDDLLKLVSVRRIDESVRPGQLLELANALDEMHGAMGRCYGPRRRPCATPDEVPLRRGDPADTPDEVLLRYLLAA